MAATIRAMPCALDLTSDQPVLNRGAGDPAGTDAGIVLGQYPEGHGGPDIGGRNRRPPATGAAPIRARTTRRPPRRRPNQHLSEPAPIQMYWQAQTEMPPILGDRARGRDARTARRPKNRSDRGLSSARVGFRGIGIRVVSLRAGARRKIFAGLCVRPAQRVLAPPALRTTWPGTRSLAGGPAKVVG